MTNPISTLPSAQLPTSATPLIDPASGLATPLFYRFLTGLFLRTGGASGTSASDVAEEARAALTTATDAQQQAALAQETATTASATASAAQATASTAEGQAQLATVAAQNAITSSCQRAANLGDVASALSARSNLGVAGFFANFQIDSPTSGLTRYFPLPVACTLPANFAGTQAFAGTAPTHSAPLTIQRRHGGTTSYIGTVTVAPGSGFVVTLQGAVSFAAGDVIVVQCPSPADATLAALGLTLYLTLA